MPCSECLRPVRERWAPILLLCVAAGFGAAGLAHLQPPVYQARGQLFLSAPDAAGPGRPSAQAYAELVTTPRVLDAVIADLELDETADHLAGRVQARGGADSVLIDITVSDTSPQRAGDIANAVALEFPGVLHRLQSAAGGSAAVSVTITRPAVVPAAPTAPHLLVDVVAGLLLGLGAGVAGVLARAGLDRRVTTAAQVGALVDAEVLGSVDDDPATAQVPLITQQPFSARAEAYRRLRIALRLLPTGSAVRSIVVTGSVPGEGISQVAANLAVAIAQTGQQVVLVDANLRRPVVAELFGIPNGYGLSSVLAGGPADDTMQPWRQDLPLRLLPAGPVPDNPSELIGSARMTQLIDTLVAAGLTVVIDAPPLLPVSDAAVLARAVDGTLLVVRSGATGRDQVAAARDLLRQAGGRLLGVVLNRVRGRARGGYASAGYTSAGYASVGHASAGHASVDLPVAVPVVREPVAGPAPVSRRAARAAARPARLRRGSGRRGRSVTELSAADLLAAIAGSPGQGGPGSVDVGPQRRSGSGTEDVGPREPAPNPATNPATPVPPIDATPVELEALPAALLGTLPADEARDLLATTPASDLLGGLPSTAIPFPTRTDDVEYGSFDELSMDRTGHDLPPQRTPSFSRSLAEATAALSVGRDHPEQPAAPPMRRDRSHR